MTSIAVHDNNGIMQPSFVNTCIFHECLSFDINVIIIILARIARHDTNGIRQRQSEIMRFFSLATHVFRLLKEFIQFLWNFFAVFLE